jgi:NO-binding membrane sensor protein with MHYT domain
MHFIGMSAMIMVDHDGIPVDVRFDIGLTLLSLVLVLLLSVAGLYVSSLDPIFMKHKRDIVEMFTKSSSSLSLTEANSMSHSAIVLLIATRAPFHLLGGGLLTGSGVVVMHYVGMSAMRFPGRIIWDSGIIAASIVIAFAASTAAFWILFRLLSLYANRESLRLMCAFTMACAVCGMHYVGMLAAKFELDESVTLEAEQGTISDTTALLAGVIIAAGAAFLGLIASLADLRYSVHKLSNELYKADDLIVHMDVPPHSNTAQSIVRYVSKRKFEGFSLGILNEKMTIHHVLDDEMTGLNTVTEAHMTSGSILHKLSDAAHAALHLGEDRRVHPETAKNSERYADVEFGHQVDDLSQEDA